MKCNTLLIHQNICCTNQSKACYDMRYIYFATVIQWIIIKYHPNMGGLKHPHIIKSCT